MMKKGTAGGWLTMYLSGYIGWTGKLAFVYFMNEMRAQMAHYTHPSIFNRSCFHIAWWYIAQRESKWKFIDLASLHKFAKPNVDETLTAIF